MERVWFGKGLMIEARMVNSLLAVHSDRGELETPASDGAMRGQP
jgi:hypothetical protein